MWIEKAKELGFSVAVELNPRTLEPRADVRADDVVKFTDDALQTILNVPRVFLPLVLKGCVEWARENNVELITAAPKPPFLRAKSRLRRLRSVQACGPGVQREVGRR